MPDPCFGSSGAGAGRHFLERDYESGPFQRRAEERDAGERTRLCRKRSYGAAHAAGLDYFGGPGAASGPLRSVGPDGPDEGCGVQNHPDSRVGGWRSFTKRFGRTGQAPSRYSVGADPGWKSHLWNGTSLRGHDRAFGRRSPGYARFYGRNNRRIPLLPSPLTGKQE